jgi:hypothetical protein
MREIDQIPYYEYHLEPTKERVEFRVGSAVKSTGTTRNTRI